MVEKTYLCCCSSFTYHSFDKWPRLPSGLFIFIKEMVSACFNENGIDREYRFTEEEYNARTLGEGVASFDEFINAIVAFVEESGGSLEDAVDMANDAYFQL